MPWAYMGWFWKAQVNYSQFLTAEVGGGGGGRGLRVGGHLAYKVSLPGAPRFCLL